LIFLDTSYINGLILKKDSYNNFSSNLKPILKSETKATNITVLVEVLNSIKFNNFDGNINEIIHQLLHLDIFDYLTAEDYKKAMDLFKYYNFSINFADCTILVSMQKYGINKIVTSDSDFAKINGIRVISGFF
jgi:hypothetical protein